MIFSRLIGTGSYLPLHVLTNAELAKRVDTSDEWIVQRTGIRQRHIAESHETASSMGTEAAKRALTIAKLKPEDLDMIIVATSTPDHIFPSTACVIQEKLGLTSGIAFDLQAACSGFIYASSVANQFIKSGMVKRVMVIGSEIMSRVLDWQDRATCVLFGDGAGAAIFEASSEPGIIATSLNASGQHGDLLCIHHLQGHALEKRHEIYPFMTMQGNRLFRVAVNLLEEEATKMLNSNQLTALDIDWMVPHQANVRIMHATAEKLGLPKERVVVTLDRHANTSAASIPLALDTFIREGHIKKGQTLLLEAFGGGVTWGSILMKY